MQKTGPSPTERMTSICFGVDANKGAVSTHLGEEHGVCENLEAREAVVLINSYKSQTSRVRGMSKTKSMRGSQGILITIYQYPLKLLPFAQKWRRAIILLHLSLLADTIKH